MVPLPQNEHAFLQLAGEQKKIDGYKVAILNSRVNPNIVLEDPKVLTIREG